MDAAQRGFEDAYWRQGAQKLVYRHIQAIKMLSADDGPVLDIGCGDGLFLGLLKEKGVASIGLDMSEVAVEACQKKGLDAQVLDAAAGLPDIRAKTAVCLDVLEHTFEPKSLLDDIHRHAERLVISVPNFVSLPARLQVLCGKVPENNMPRKGHVYWFTLEVLKKLLRDTGWEPTELAGNAWGASVPVVGRILGLLARCWPNGLYLSFVVKAKRI